MSENERKKERTKEACEERSKERRKEERRQKTHTYLDTGSRDVTMMMAEKIYHGIGVVV